MSCYQHLPLGKKSLYTDQYDATLLCSVPRDLHRRPLDIAPSDLPFQGQDTWTLYELSWLNSIGMPQVAIGEVHIDASSVNIIESKSFKLYLNSFNQTCFSNWQQVTERLQCDLTQCALGQVAVKLMPLTAFDHQSLAVLEGICIDQQITPIVETGFDPALLAHTTTGKQREECLVSHLFKSNCPVTAQPDWASVQIHYQGPGIDHASLLRYLISFRHHCAFHEQCVEQIFCDIQHYCRPTRLTVLARYTRRGGLEINPFRSNWQPAPANLRLARQ